MITNGGHILWFKLRTLLFGHPLSSQNAEQSKVGVLGGIPIFGSDIISSEGYAPDEILYILLLAGSLGYAFVMKVSLVIVILLASIFLVYRKAIQKYPQGGGSYTIAQAYLGETAGFVAGAALSVDYILTVAVSVSSAIENFTGIMPWLAPTPHKVIADCLVIIFMAWINLRGLKESARLFTLPVYLYILSLIALIGTGLIKIMIYGATPQIPAHMINTNASSMTWFIFARAVAGGTTALTGIEAVSNGVTAFKTPAQNRAIRTLLVLSVLVAGGLLGLTYLAGVYHLVPDEGNTILNQLGQIIYGLTIPYYILMGTAAAILMIAANTPFAGFPILLSLMARDGCAPRYFKNLGDRLVYNVGIWTLFFISVFLIIIFQGDTHMMLPLYAIGVLLSFSLTGIGLARHVMHEKGKKWVSDFAVFAFGGALSFLVFLVFIITKFTQGAWIIMIVIPLLMLLFRGVKNVYRSEIHDLEVTPEALAQFQRHVAILKRRRAHSEISEYHNKIIIPVYDLNLMVLNALNYAYSLTPQVLAVHIASDPDRADKLLKHWSAKNIAIPLKIIPSPYRATVKDFLTFLDTFERNTNYDTITVVIPEYVPEKLWHNILHNQTGQFMKVMILLKKSILVTSVPYHPEKDRINPEPFQVKP